MNNLNTAAALRLASCQRRAVTLLTGHDAALTLGEAAALVGMRAPVTEDDLRELARACVLADVRTNLDDEGGEWTAMRTAAREALLRMAGALVASQQRRRVCAVCGGKRFADGHGVTQCKRCGALTPCRTALDEFDSEGGTR